MEYRTLGRTGMHVSTFCLGTMVLGAWGNRDEDECQAIVHAALDAGINFIDTADVYAFGESEEIVGPGAARPAGRRSSWRPSSSIAMGEDPNHRGASRRWIVRAVEDSLRRLDTDWIDLYQVHRPDPDTDLDETLGALSDLVHAGKIRAFGTSTFPAELLVEAQWMARPAGSRPAVDRAAAVLHLRPRHRAGGAADVPALRARRARVGPAQRRMADGQVPGRAAPAGVEGGCASRTTSTSAGRVHERKMALVEDLLQVADEAGLRLVDLAHAFVLAHPAVTSAIVGPRTLGQLEDALAGAGTPVPDEVLGPRRRAGPARSDAQPVRRRLRTAGPRRRPAAAAERRGHRLGPQ